MKSPMTYAEKVERMWRRTQRLAKACGLRFQEVYQADDIPNQWRSDVLGNVGYAPRSRTIYIAERFDPLSEALHEVCHWLVATPKERTLVNWGYQSQKFQPPKERENAAIDVNIGIAYRWGYRQEAEELRSTFGATDVTVTHCADLAQQYLDKNGLTRKRRK